MDILCSSLESLQSADLNEKEANTSLQMTALFIQRALLHTTRQCLRRGRSNPGMAYQLEQLREIDESRVANEDYGEMEADFMSLNQTHRQHEAEQQKQNDRVRQFMIKHKYFRDVKLPNLLLYAEKEQMRLLHERDPEEWSVERLAESFPATPDIVQKILRAKWRPRNVQRIREHDETVMHNWEQLRSGQGDVKLPEHLMQHLQKFAQRRRSDLKQINTKNWPTRPTLPVPQINEFRSLLTNGESPSTPSSQFRLTTGNEPKSATQQLLAPHDQETYLLDKVQNRRKMRLQELKELKMVTEEDKDLDTRSLENPSGTGRILPSFAQKFESSDIVISAADQKRYEITKVKERIVIPRKLYKEGATYRVEDAYYDDDGEFLYRVPGMTKSNK